MDEPEKRRDDVEATESDFVFGIDEPEIGERREDWENTDKGEIVKGEAEVEDHAREQYFGDGRDLAGFEKDEVAEKRDCVDDGTWIALE